MLRLLLHDVVLQLLLQLDAVLRLLLHDVVLQLLLRDVELRLLLHDVVLQLLLRGVVLQPLRPNPQQPTQSLPSLRSRFLIHAQSDPNQLPTVLSARTSCPTMKWTIQTPTLLHKSFLSLRKQLQFRLRM